MTEIDPNGHPVDIGAGIVLRTPGLTGNVEVVTPPPRQQMTSAKRGKLLDSVMLAQALERANVDIDQVINITDTKPVSMARNIAMRSTPAGQPAIEVEVPGPGDSWGQMLLATDENGIATWHFAVDESGGQGVLRSSRKRVYLIPAYVPDKKPQGDTRGPFGWLGRKIIRVLSFSLEPVISEVGNYFVKKWESEKRWYQLRSFTPATYLDGTAPDLSADDFAKLSKGRALLFIHGTFSRAHAAFDFKRDGDVLQQLEKRYEDRIFAFNHPTASEGPFENTKWFVKKVTDNTSLNTSLDLDIVCHSRGGYIARMLAEHLDQFSLGKRTITVNQIIFVATPNSGTSLADPEHMSEMVDVYTNALILVPDNPIIDTLEGVIEVVKQIAVATLKGLDGLQSMNPNGDYLHSLNTSTNRGDTIYRAITANYEPTSPGFKKFVADRLMDRVFGGKDNDLVVPTEGVYQSNGATPFPIQEIRKFTAQDGIQHLTFFNHKDVGQQLLDWLKP